MVGERTGADEALAVSVIEANIDDLNPQVLAYATERLLEFGALDVTLQPIVMKKGRPGNLLRVIAKPEDREALAQLVFAETSTLGLRIYHRRAPRAGALASPKWKRQYGKVRMKVSSEGYYAPEYEDCRKLARESGVALKHIIAEANYAYLNRTEMKILPHHSHLLRERRAAHRPRLHHHRGRPDQALQAHAGLRGRADHRLRRARRERGARRRARRQDAQGVFATSSPREFQRQWEVLGLQIDYFQRTTSPQHARVVQDLFERCRDNGYIYKGSYTGQYCIFDNLYVNDAKPGDPCPDCGRPTETITEENFFFKLSAFQDKLLELYEAQPRVHPAGNAPQRSALVSSSAGLNDLSITRTNIKWGIPVVGEAPHVFYVWFDALTTYMSAVEGKGLWPADLHLIGKEIVRFHAVFWPAFLMAAGLPLPKRIFAHGWLLFENDKMSKSRGNIVRAEPIREVMGADALRYFLLREVVFGQDGSFSYDALVGRYNSDLANGLGNLASRTLTMIQQYRKGVDPAKAPTPAIADARRARPSRRCSRPSTASNSRRAWKPSGR